MLGAAAAGLVLLWSLDPAHWFRLNLLSLTPAPSIQQSFGLIPAEGIRHLDQCLELADFLAQCRNLSRQPVEQYFGSHGAGDAAQIDFGQVTQAHLQLCNKWKL